MQKKKNNIKKYKLTIHADAFLIEVYRLVTAN